MKKKFDNLFEGVSFWKQIFIWLISISLVSKILNIFFSSTNWTFLILILKLFGSFFVGLVILSVLKLKK